jgi:hypothetical protein
LVSPWEWSRWLEGAEALRSFIECLSIDLMSNQKSREIVWGFKFSFELANVNEVAVMGSS